MSVEQKAFGMTHEGKEASLFTVTNQKGMTVVLCDFGANLVSILVPDQKGEVKDVLLGFDNLEQYYGNGSFFGAVIGPSANRIGGAAFEIAGKKYQLAVNDGPNNLHSDFQKGYHKQMWEAEVLENGVKFVLTDADMNMGFPGNKKVSITYILGEENDLHLIYHAEADTDTLINMTNHAYFNLAGQDAGSIEDHILTLKCSNYTPVVAGAIPTGEIAPVAGTPMDFTTAKVIGKEIGEDFEQLKLTQGYDHNWVIDGADGTMREFALVEDPKSGRKMKVFTDLPGVQFYAGNCIAPETGKGGAEYGPRHGLCLETQCYPNSINTPGFPNVVFGPGKDYDTETIYQFI